MGRPRKDMAQETPPEEQAPEQNDEPKEETIDPCLVKLINQYGDVVMAHPTQVLLWESHGYRKE
jgi:hypothetical protein